MNNYLDTFNNIQNSIDELSNNENISLETKQAALYLKHGIELCIQEIKHSANKLNNLTSICSKHLQHTENTWLIKPSITGFAKYEIWTDIGNLSGFSIKINQLLANLKNEAILKNKKLWNIKFECLRMKYFLDGKGMPKKGVGWDEKSKFTNDIKNDVTKHCAYIMQLVKQKMQLIYAEFESMNLGTLYNCLNLQKSLLHEQKQSKVNANIDLIPSETISKFKKPVNYLYKNIINISFVCNDDLKALVNKEWGDISWEDFCRFDNIFLIKLEKIITVLFEERVKFVTEGIDKLIMFYNHFLEMQERYERETPEQRKAEIFWIEKQLKELEKLQTEIGIILNAS
jgi:hypothetical protein